jgi:LPS O-antigen subunit length determinant protein (WzzB/FepE family)
MKNTKKYLAPITEMPNQDENSAVNWLIENLEHWENACEKYGSNPYFKERLKKFLIAEARLLECQQNKMYFEIGQETAGDKNITYSSVANFNHK